MHLISLERKQVQRSEMQWGRCGLWWESACWDKEIDTLWDPQSKTGRRCERRPKRTKQQFSPTTLIPKGVCCRRKEGFGALYVGGRGTGLALGALSMLNVQADKSVNPCGFDTMEWFPLPEGPMGSVPRPFLPCSLSTQRRAVMFILLLNWKGALFLFLFC